MKDIKFAIRRELRLLVPDFTTAGPFQPENIHYLLRPKKEHVGSKTEKRGSKRR